MAEGNLFFPNCQPVLREKDSEDPFDFPMGLLFQALVHFGTFSLEQSALVRWRQTNAAQKTCAARIRRQRQSELKKVDFDVPYLLLAPRQPWEPCGQACSLQAVHWLPEGLADYNPRSASPSDVWANDSAYHNPPPKVVAKRETTPSFRSKCIARIQEQQPPSLKRETAMALDCLGAFSEVCA